MQIFCYNPLIPKPEEKTMTTENPQPTETKRFTYHPYIAGIITIIILAILGTGYLFWYVPSVNEAIESSEYENVEDQTPNTTAQAVHATSPAVMAPAAPAGQELLAQQLQKVKAANIPLAENNSILPSLNNQVAIIQLLLANQQFPAALNLLNSLENDAALMPTAAQAALQTAVESDRENIQKTQAVVGQIDGQLQQLEHYLNQQLLERLAQQNINSLNATNNAEPTVPFDPTWTAKVWDKIKDVLSQGVQVQHKNNNAEISEPNFYTAIMLQMALQRAQFALEQGNWTEYQLTLSSLQTWVTPDLLTWLPDAPGMIKTITELAEQPSPFANANVNTTQRALNSLIQELHP
jgi:hypothetical protein